VADVVVDASVWVSRLVSVDVHHARTRRWLEGAVREGGLLVTPALALPELSGAIARRTRIAGLAEQAVRLVRGLPGLRLVALDGALAEHAAALAARLALRGADAVYVGLAWRLGLPLVSWDREQRARAAGAIRVSAPGP
jgi:predicted nucleic acid-binding protein